MCCRTRGEVSWLVGHFMELGRAPQYNKYKNCCSKHDDKIPRWGVCLHFVQGPTGLCSIGTNVGPVVVSVRFVWSERRSGTALGATGGGPVADAWPTLPQESGATCAESRGRNAGLTRTALRHERKVHADTGAPAHALTFWTQF